MNWEFFGTVKIKEYNGYKLDGKTAYAKAKKLYLSRYPSEKTIEKLKSLGIKEIIYKNGDFITL